LLLWTILITVLGIVALSFLVPFRVAMGFVPPTISEFGIVIAVVVAYLAATEVTKRWFYRRKL
jgi:hypothetical protein